MPLCLALDSPDATKKLGADLVRCLPIPSVVLLSGELGTGKTTLVQGLAKALGVDEPVTSPTFNLLNEYCDHNSIPLYHFDLYRLKPVGVAQLAPDLYWEGVEVDPGITVIEWCERLPFLPESYVSITLKHRQDGGREAVIDEVGESFALETLNLRERES
ncbi:MAG: tRNA (adenosine(37)-N6)-threonylcarbamoyltransferase complex ATPase subunit type 1 TsaE [Cyanobacteria bacterium P01_H01_bin.15]